MSDLLEKRSCKFSSEGLMPKRRRTRGYSKRKKYPGKRGRKCKGGFSLMSLAPTVFSLGSKLANHFLSRYTSRGVARRHHEEDLKHNILHRQANE